MKTLTLFLVCSLAIAQTTFPTRVDITANPARTAGGELRVNNSTNSSYVSLTSGSLLFANTTALSDASLVFPSLTGLYNNASGLQVWRSGLSGARASVTPGSATGSGRITLCNTNISACTGFYADPAMASSAVYQMPGTDGSSGDCLSTNGAATLSWVSCSGGGSAPPFVDTTNIIKGSVDATKLLRFEVDGLTTATTRTWTAQNADLTVAGIDIAQTWTATQTMRDLLPATTDTYKFGDDAVTKRWYSASINRISGVCPNTTPFTCTQSNNYLTTRKIDLYNYDGNGDLFMSMRAAVGAAGNRYIEFLDNAGTAMLTLQRMFLTSTTNQAIFDLSLIPSGTRDVGSNSTPWNNGYFSNGIIGNIQSSSLSGTGTRCVNATSTGNLGVTSSACLADPTTTTGDMIYRSSGVLTRLPIGSTNNVLTVSGGIPTWSSSLNISSLTLGSGNGVLYSSSGVVANVSGFATDCVQANGSTRSCISNPLTSTGDIFVGGSLGTPSRLAIGSTNQVLVVSGGTPAWATFSGSSPISYSAGTISCSTCFTTSGGQTVAGTSTFSTISLSSALDGTFNMSGNQTVTGNWYARSFSGSGISCSGVSDGWLGWDYSNQYLIMCAGGARYRVQLAAY